MINTSRSVRRQLNRLKSPDIWTRADAAERLGLGDDLSAVPALRVSTRDRSSEVRQRAVEALGNLGQGSSREVVEALRDADELVRICAAEAIYVRTPQVVALLRVTLRDPSPLVRSYAAAALGRVGRQRERALLQKAVRREIDQNATLGYYEGLWMLGDSTAIDHVEELLRNGDYRTRLAAAKALASTFASSKTSERVSAALNAQAKSEKSKVVKSAILRLVRKRSARSAVK